MPSDHGGNLRALAATAGIPPDRLVDFSASINPLGLSPRVEEALRAALVSVVHYPDPAASALSEALAAHHDLLREQVLPASGSTELIYLLARALVPRRALVLHPAFSEYEAALRPVGAEIEHAVLDPALGFAPELTSLLPRLVGQDLLVLANPNNPAGCLIPKPELLALVAAAERAGAIVVVDEAFIDFVEEASLKKELAEFPHLLLLRSLTKFFALPGLRLGYALGSPEILARLLPWAAPWRVNSLAEAGGIAALADREYQERSRLLIPRWREELAGELEALGAFRVVPGVANYLLARIASADLAAPRLTAELLREGVAIRDCSSFCGLGPAFVRLAVRPPAERRVLLEALARCL